MTLEEKIKALMNGQSLEEKVTVTNEKGEQITGDQLSIESGSDEEGEEKEPQPEDGEGDQTQVSQDQGQDQTSMNRVKVSEDWSASDYNKKHEQPGMKIAQKMDKIKPDTHTDKSADGGLNKKLKAGMDKKQPSDLKSAGVSQEASNAKNAVDKQACCSVKEHMDAMFEGEELSEDFVAKASTIFESAVSQQVELRLVEEVEKLQEDFQVKLDEAVEDVQGALVEQIDGYLNLVVETWLNDNIVALESGIKVEMVASFIDGMKSLLKEHYIEVPEDKLDIIEEQAEQIEKLKHAASVLDEQHGKMQSKVIELSKKSILESLCHDLTMAQAEKFSSICSNVAFISEEEYTDKLLTLKNSYFPKGKSIESTIQSQAISESLTEAVEDKQMAAYAKVLSGQIKF
jgi:hypothetical protein